MEFLDWKVESDSENIRDGAIELRASVAENMYKKYFETPESAQRYVAAPRSQWRMKSIMNVELISGKKISGQVIEIGAGTGFCSAELSKLKDVEKVYCLDYDKVSVEVLMPLVFKNLKADLQKVIPVLGSYNKMKCPDNSIDYVFSLGAIHHSENLLATFSEAFRVLKPGGFLVAVEHCHENSYSIEQQTNDDEELIDEARVKRLYNIEGAQIKAKDNSDHNYRLCEFESSAYAAGFNILPYVFDLEGEKADETIFKDPKPFSGYSNRVFYPYYALIEKEPVFDNFVIVAQKPDPGHPSKIFTNTNIGIKKNKSFFSKLFK